MIYSANDKYRATIRSTWIASPADSTIQVTAIPTNVPTIVVLGWNTQYETSFYVTGTSGDNSSNYALTGVTKIKGYSGNIPENTAVNCLNVEEFFNQYATAIATMQEALYIDGISSNSMDGVLDEDDMVSDSATKVPTQQSVKAYVANNQGIISTTKYAPQGFLLNGKIVPSVASNNLTVAIKGMDGNDPSAANPVYCRIGDTVRTISTALSVTKNAGTNWCNAGSTELATSEIDYFVYLGYNTTDGVVVGFSRLAWANKYSHFSATTTNEGYCAISTISNAASEDYYELIGRFAATLSAGSGYTWTIPTFYPNNLIQRPIYESRILGWVGTVSGGDSTYAPTPAFCKYQVQGNKVFLTAVVSGTRSGTAGPLVSITLPFTLSTSYYTLFGGNGTDNGVETGMAVEVYGNTFNIRRYNGANFTNGTVIVRVSGWGWY